MTNTTTANATLEAILSGLNATADRKMTKPEATKAATDAAMLHARIARSVANAKHEADRLARVAATDAIIAEDVANDNREVGTLAARVEARIAENNSALEGTDAEWNAGTVLVGAESPKVQAENAKRAAAGKPKMTAAEARTFDMYSERNAATAEDGCESGECVAYESIFTFKRWIAQGRVVRKGQKATFVEMPKFADVIDKATGEKKKVRVGSIRVAVFCKCQTEKLTAKGRAA